MPERQQHPPTPGAAAVPGPGTAPPPRGGGRRLIDTPANDNRMSAGRRVARAALFVAIGGVIAWLLHEFLG